jgi:hypothetical protein
MIRKNVNPFIIDWHRIIRYFHVGQNKFGEFQMDVRILIYDKGSEILFRLKLDVLRDIMNEGNFHKDVTDIKILLSDLLEIARNVEMKRQEV